MRDAVTTLVAQIAPQRSTQYSALASALAPHELTLSPLGRQISNLRSVRLGNQEYLSFDMCTPPDERQLTELGLLALTGAFFVYYEQIGEHSGPFLRPLETHRAKSLPPELLMARRYRGKTNELFTLFLCNIARFSSTYADRPWNTLSVLDPLAGGGTTLFAGLVLGANVAGVENEINDVESTAIFLSEYLREQGVRYELTKERLRKLGHRWSFAIGKPATQRCLLAHGDTAQSKELIASFRPHLIVTDLPYGIQHQGPLIALLTTALPVWADLLVEGGALTFSWDATRFPRSQMITLVESVSPLQVLNEPPYDRLGHRVDRVIKQRDVLTARSVNNQTGAIS
jgi:hypothetical protein